MAPEPDRPDALDITMVEDVLISPEYLNSDDKKTYLREKMIATTQMIMNVASQTIGQRQNQMWCAARKMRVTASNFGIVLHALRTKRLINYSLIMYMYVLESQRLYEVHSHNVAVLW